MREKRIHFPSVHQRRIELIISIGQSEILRPCDTVCGPECTIWIAHYGIGWTIRGCEEPVTSEYVPAVVNHVAISEKEEALESSSAVELLKKCYVLEFTENLHEPRVGLSQSDQRAADIQHSTVRYLGDHYKVGLL